MVIRVRRLRGRFVDSGSVVDGAPLVGIGEVRRQVPAQPVPGLLGGDRARRWLKSRPGSATQRLAEKTSAADWLRMPCTTVERNSP